MIKLLGCIFYILIYFGCIFSLRWFFDRDFRKTKRRILDYLLEKDLSEFKVGTSVCGERGTVLYVVDIESHTRIEITPFGIGHWILFSEMYIDVISGDGSFSFDVKINKHLYEKLKPLFVEMRTCPVNTF